MAREQPLNIEADAELGMPIDLVGIPKVFDGDESGKKEDGRIASRWQVTDGTYSYTGYATPSTSQCR